MIDISDLLNAIDGLYEARGEYKLDSKTAWIALVAHYLELREIHEKSKMKWASKKPKGIIKDPETIRDRELGNVVRRPVKGKRKKETAVTELDPRDFARWRGIDPELFSKMVERYQKRAERFRKTQTHKNIMRRVLRADPQFRRLRYGKQTRRRNPEDTLKQVALVAKYLVAKERSPSTTQQDWAKRNNVSNTNLSNLLDKYRQEAEAYIALKKGGHEIGEPEPASLSKKEKDVYHQAKEDNLKPLLPALAAEISKENRESRTPAGTTIKVFAARNKVSATDLSDVWYKLKDTYSVKDAIAKKMGTAPPKAPVKKRRGRPPKPKVVRPVFKRGLGGYKISRKGEDIPDAWMELAIAVEKDGEITDAMALHHADLVGIKIIKAVKSFPEKWGDNKIAEWMLKQRADYIRNAKPKLEAELKEQGLWNPQKTTVKNLPTPVKGMPAAVIQADPWIGLKGWHEARRPRVLIIGGLPARNLKAHLGWLGRYFKLNTLGTQQTGKKGTGSVNFIRNAVHANDPDLIILLSGFMRHSEINAAKNSAKPGVPVVSNVKNKALKALGSAAAGAHQQYVAPWFVDAYEKEKGKITDSLDQIIYNLLEGTSLETIFCA